MLSRDNRIMFNLLFVSPGTRSSRLGLRRRVTRIRRRLNGRGRRRRRRREVRRARRATSPTSSSSPRIINCTIHNPSKTRCQHEQPTDDRIMWTLRSSKPFNFFVLYLFTIITKRKIQYLEFKMKTNSVVQKKPLATHDKTHTFVHLMIKSVF